MDLTSRVSEIFTEHLKTTGAAAQSLAAPLAQAARLLARSLRQGNKVLACGNGGSAADAQHFASELINRFERERPGLAAVALTCDGSTLTSIANDYRFEEVFARQVAALGQAGDVLLAITTSGRSPNVLRAMAAARELGMHCVLVTGRDGGDAMRELGDSDVGLCVTGSSTARIQEVHILVIHCLCELIDAQLLEQG